MELPYDVLVHLFSLFDDTPEGLKKLCACACVCRSWRDAVADQQLWIHLSKQHLGDTGREGASPQHLRSAVIIAARAKENWELGRCTVRTLRGHTKPVSALLVAGRHVITGSHDSTTRCWPVGSTRSSACHKEHVNWVRALDGDGRLVVSGSADKTVRVRKLADPYRVMTLRGHSGEVRKVCLDSGRKQVISASYDHTLKVWDVRSVNHRRDNRLLSTLNGHTNAVTDAVVESNRIWSTSMDGTVIAWDRSTGVEEHVIETHEESIENILSQGTVVATLSNSVHLWDCRTFLLSATLARSLFVSSGSGILSCFCFTNNNEIEDGMCVAVGCTNGAIGVVDLRHTRTLLRRLHLHKDYVACVKPAGPQYLVSGGGDGRVHTWREGQAVHTFRASPHHGVVTMAVRYPALILASSFDNKVRLWDFSPTGGVQAADF